MGSTVRSEAGEGKVKYGTRGDPGDPHLLREWNCGDDAGLLLRLDRLIMFDALRGGRRRWLVSRFALPICGWSRLDIISQEIQTPGETAQLARHLLSSFILMQRRRDSVLGDDNRERSRFLRRGLSGIAERRQIKVGLSWIATGFGARQGGPRPKGEISVAAGLAEQGPLSETSTLVRF